MLFSHNRNVGRLDLAMTLTTTNFNKSCSSISVSHSLAPGIEYFLILVSCHKSFQGLILKVQRACAMGSQEESFDDLVKKAWKDGLQNDDVVYDDFRPVVASDQGIPFEVRYLPTLQEKSKASNDDDDNDGKENKDDKHQDDSKESEALRPPARASTDAEEEKGVETRDENQGKVADDYGPGGIDPSDTPSHHPARPSSALSRLSSSACSISTPSKKGTSSL